MSNFFVDFREAENLTDLARMLSVPEDLLQSKLEQDIPIICLPTLQEVFYTSFMQEATGTDHETYQTEHRHYAFHKIKIPKKNKHSQGAKRIVWEIQDRAYQELYKSLSWKLEHFFKTVNNVYPHDAIYGYIRGKNILENAQQHCCAKTILHADIKNFFPSISKDRVSLMLQSFGIKTITSDILASILTIEGKLALGLHTSPLISNIICLELDQELSTLANSYNGRYTRYADDITISGDDLPSKEEVENILNRHGFAINNQKFRITKPGWHHFVTGLSVETRIPRIPKHMRKKLRQELYYCKKYGITEHINWIETLKDERYMQRNINRIDGTVKYISYFDRLLDNSDFDDEWNAIKTEQAIYPHYINQNEEFVLLFVDETEIETSKGKYLAIGLVSILERDFCKINRQLKGLLARYAKDPFKPIKKETLQKNGLHFSDATEDLRSDYTDLLTNENLKVYIGYKKLDEQSSYSETYYDLLNNLLRDRMLNTKDGIYGICIEQNDKISTKHIKEAFEDFRIKFADKSCLPLSLADFTLGYFRNYILNTSSIRPELFFEKLRAKYKVIKNIDNNHNFTRKRPFQRELFENDCNG